MQRPRKINENQEPIYSIEETIELLYRGHDLKDLNFDKAISFDSNYEELFGTTFRTTPKDLSWDIPEPYNTMDVHDYVLGRCKSEAEIERVKMELSLYEERDLINLLRFMIYLVDYMRENNCIWGVGRGSSVASYVLYLIGIHKINSIKYELCITEFLK